MSTKDRYGLKERCCSSCGVTFYASAAGNLCTDCLQTGMALRQSSDIDHNAETVLVEKLAALSLGQWADRSAEDNHSHLEGRIRWRFYVNQYRIKPTEAGQ